MDKMYVLDADTMKQSDEGTIKELGISQDVLMERAALAIASCIKKYEPNRILCVCGKGNNGGDAIAAARILYMQGRCAEIYLCDSPEKYKSSAKKQLDIFIKIGGRVVTDRNFAEYDMIVDGIFGIGLDRSIEGEYASVVEAVNKAGDNGSIIIAADMPSGIHTDTGAVLGVAVRATETVSFAYYKPGHLLYPGAGYCGKVTIEEIGISYKYFYKNNEISMFTLDANTEVVLTSRKRDGNKGTFGRVLIVAGSSEMYGACYLSALGAFRVGVGLVDIYTHEINRRTLQTMLPEAILHTYDEKGMDESVLCDLIERADCVVVGPGLSTDETAMQLVRVILDTCPKIIVADADALNCIAKRKELLNVQKKHENRTMIITPHPAELSRLTGKSVGELKRNYIRAVKEFAMEYGMIVVGKDAGTIVSDGKNVYVNQSGNDGMATAGSGDVLSGIIGGLVAGGENGFDASWKGVFLHGKAGDAAAKKNGTHSMIARDIAEGLCNILKEKDSKEEFRESL